MALPPSIRPRARTGNFRMTPSPIPLRDKARSLAVIMGVAGILMLPVLWNGAPLYYWDSVDYIHLPFSWDLPAYRTMPYGLFTGIARPFGTLWAVIVVQALLVAYTLHETLAVFAPGAHRRLLLLVTPLLLLFSGLPWQAGQIMPDAFSGLVVLCIPTLAFSGGVLSLPRRLGIAAVLALATTLHTSHIAVGAGLLIMLFVGALWFRKRWPALRPRLLLPLVAFFTGILSIAAVHWVTVGQPFVTQPSMVLWLGRLVQDGIAQRFLDDNCKRGDEYKLCKVSGKLPKTANEFLWDYGGAPLQIYGSWQKMRPEARRIVQKSFRDYPWLHAEAAAKLSVEQLVRFKTGDGLQNSMKWLLEDTIKKYYPADLDAWLASQQMSKDGIDFKTINKLQVPLLALAQLLVIVMAVACYRRRQRLGFILAAITVIALLGNAFVCGALSNPNDRYQSRLAWLSLVVLAVGVSGVSRKPETLDG